MHHAVIDRLSMQSTFLHRLDARTKLLAVIAFTVFVISMPPASISILICCAAGPFAMLVIAKVPLKLAALQILCALPFIAVFALSTIFYDRAPVTVVFGPLEFHLTQGTVRCIVIIIKFVVTMTALIAMAATTRFSSTLNALTMFRVPRILVMQIGLLHRYIFILVDRACNMIRARNARKFKYTGLHSEFKTTASMLANLAASSTQTATRVAMSMSARGFTGKTHSLIKMKFTKSDLIFVICLALYLAGLYILKGAI